MVRFNSLMVKKKCLKSYLLRYPRQFVLGSPEALGFHILESHYSLVGNDVQLENSPQPCTPQLHTVYEYQQVYWALTLSVSVVYVGLPESAGNHTHYPVQEPHSLTVKQKYDVSEVFSLFCHLLTMLGKFLALPSPPCAEGTVQCRISRRYPLAIKLFRNCLIFLQFLYMYTLSSERVANNL